MEPAVALTVRPWPSLCSAAVIDSARTLLGLKPVLTIVGTVGSGRTELATELAELPFGTASSWHRARFGEKDLPYFALRQLFGTIDHSPAATLDEVERSVLAALRDVVEPLRIVLPDAYLCDGPSIEVLVRLADAGRLRLIATLTPETVGAQQRIMAAGGLVTLPPLDETAIAEVVQIRFGAEPHPLVTELLLECSEGSYAVVRDLTDASAAAGAIVVVEGVLVLDPTDQQVGAERFTSLLPAATTERLGGGRAITDLVHLTALLDGLDVEEARACLGPEVDLALGHGGFTVHDGVLAFCLRAEGKLALRTAPPERRVELFDRFAERLPRSIARRGAAGAAAEWWRSAGHQLPVELAGRATREANLIGDYRRALIYSDPAANDQFAVVEPMERAHAFSELGDNDALIALCLALDPSELSEDELLPYFWGIRLLGDETQQTLLEQAVRSDDPEQQRCREAVRMLHDLAGQAFHSGGDQLVSQLRSLAFSAHLSPGNRAIGFAAVAAALRHSGRPAQAAESAAFALNLLGDQHDSVRAFQLDLAREFHIMALVSALDVADAEQALRAYSSGVFASAGSGRLTMVLHTYVAMVRGDMAMALASARLCLRTMGVHDPHQVRGWVEAMAAESLVHLGRAREARGVLTDAKRHPSAVPQTDLMRRIMIATCHDALADPEEALEILAAVVDESRLRDLLMTQIDAAAASVLIGGPPQIATLLQSVDHLDEPVGTPLFWQAFARSARAYDIAGIVDLAHELDDLGARLFAARVAQFVLDMARRATDLLPQTREHLRDLADLTVRAS